MLVETHLFFFYTSDKYGRLCKCIIREESILTLYLAGDKLVIYFSYFSPKIDWQFMPIVSKQKTTIVFVSPFAWKMQDTSMVRSCKRLTHLCRMDFSTLSLWTSISSIRGVWLVYSLPYCIEIPVFTCKECSIWSLSTVFASIPFMGR